MSKLRRRVSWFFALGWRDKALVAECIAMLAAARVALRTIQSRKLLPGAGHVTPGSGASAPPAAAVRVGATLEKIAPAMPFRAMCLEKALAGQWMLRRRGIRTTLFLGMAKEGSTYLAHAWLRCNGATITGDGPVPFTPLASFGEPASGRRDPLLE